MNVTGTPARRLPAASLTVAVADARAPVAPEVPAAMSLYVGVVSATPVVVALFPPSIVTVQTTGPVADQVIVTAVDAF